ncbi:flagellar hook protein FlgE [Morganella psychrotolerans]|uniref:Flagellar hook protein FlgE n=1 Tax=Morganella psychrotolerans TaxID=368603 RepID=A0A5M9RC05_9GAMM|nr:flagellar hook protein FlgE [Morganella psychrotolerans]KAA8717528.1 flagellar hook protein FlgE [Morganella psychrotolerans]OBU08211.1 flagellar hook protein FlgE [Morganella psychrotolerans]
MSFSQAVSGLNAASSGLDSIGNNIANSATNGFKGAHASFSDMFAGSGVGLGVNVAAISQNFKDGSITRTDRATDVAISGNGFFRLLDTNGDVVYSRDGEFHRDKSGNLVNNQGMMVSGFPAGMDANGNVTIQTGGVPQPLNIPTDMMDAKASAKGELTINLNSDDKVPTVTTFDPDNPDSYNFSTTMTAYDSQGNTHEIAVYFVKTADNKWDVKAKDSTDKTSVIQDLGPMEFDGNGKLKGPADFTVAYKGLNGADPGAIDLSLNKTRQQKVTESSVSKIDVDGYQSGEYTNFKIENDGTITASYSNQQKRTVGKMALSSFANPNGLASQGGNVWKATNASGNPMDGVPGTGQFGNLTGGALEASNVDMSQELINMIVMQRNYQSNSQTIKTQDQMLQTLVNLR